MKHLAYFCLLLGLGCSAAADPAFTDRSHALQADHIYSGGWEHFVGGGVAVFDCNADGYPDIFAAGGQAPARLFVNHTEGNNWRFEDGNIDPMQGTTGAYPLDIDSDGVLDLFVLRVGANRILRGLGECRFEDMASDLNFQTAERWSTAFSAVWESGNALPTLAIGNYVDRTDPDGPFEACDENTLHRPAGETYAAPIPLRPGFCALSILFSDWRKSGTADLRVSNDRHYYVRGGSEQMWDMQDMRLLGPDDGWQPISIWGMGIASHDINGDLRPDVMLTSMGDQLMQMATPDGFVAAPFSIGTYAHRPFVGDDGRPSTGWHAEFADVDNDGRTDLFIAKGNVDQMPGSAMDDPNNLLIQNDDGTFRETADIAGVASMARSRGAALADFDRDGKLDLVVLNRRVPMELYQNVTEQTGGWLGITLHQPGTNGFAVGAWVELRDSTGQISTHEVTVGGGHAGGQHGPAHFGLGKSPDVDLRVKWPDGLVSDWIRVAANQYVTLDRTGEGGAQLSRH